MKDHNSTVAHVRSPLLSTCNIQDNAPSVSANRMISTCHEQPISTLSAAEGVDVEVKGQSRHCDDINAYIQRSAHWHQLPQIKDEIDMLGDSC